MPLTDDSVENAKPGLKRRKIGDAHGLYIEISPTGGRWWRFRYRVAGREKRISLGVYPEISLEKARKRCLEAREALYYGVDPSRMARRKNTPGSMGEDAKKPEPRRALD